MVCPDELFYCKILAIPTETCCYQKYLLSIALHRKPSKDCVILLDLMVILQIILFMQQLQPGFLDNCSLSCKELIIRTSNAMRA